jgi:Esterase/lipase
MHTLLQIVIIVVASVNLLMTRFALFRLRQPTTLLLWVVKVFTSALAPLLLLVGLLSAGAGFILSSTPAIAIGSLSALLYLIHTLRITRAPAEPTDFISAFGFDWGDRISSQTKAYFLPRRYVFRLPKSSEPVLKQNVPFYIIPEAGRGLLCDIWQPPKEIDHTGVAFIYLHGSAWTFLDKDYGTRPFFKRLAEQGHVIMDVAYRLFPETGFMGMVHDVKHAIAWIKENAAAYGISTDRVVIGGGSAGAHVALLAAYTEHEKIFTPEELQSVDLSVCGVISLYGQSDLAATFYHTAQHLTSHSALGQQEKGAAGMPRWIRKRMGDDYHRLGFDKQVEPGMLAPILGGNPDEKRGSYSLFSPVIHVHKGCPPTLIVHGEQDILAPVEAIRKLHVRLGEVGVPVVTHVLPQTDHAFDLILPGISPSAHNALYDIERFLAIMATLPKTSPVEKINKGRQVAEEYLYD